MTTLTVPAPFRPADAPPWIESWSAARDAPDLRLVFDGVVPLDPAGLALVAAGVADRADRGLETAMTCADGPGRDHLDRLEFVTELGLRVDPDQLRERPGLDPLVPLTRITDLKVARRLADETTAFLEDHVEGLPPSLLRAARFAFEELASNVVAHSERPATGFGLAQATPGRFQIAFADAGVGFLGSLNRNPELAGRVGSDSDAVRLALQKGISRAPGQGHMGIGLAFLPSLLEVADGELWVATGSSVSVRRSVGSGPPVEEVPATRDWPGTWICLELALG